VQPRPEPALWFGGGAPVTGFGAGDWRRAAGGGDFLRSSRNEVISRSTSLNSVRKRAISEAWAR
jgi:hypothetical protein